MKWRWLWMGSMTVAAALPAQGSALKSSPYHLHHGHAIKTHGATHHKSKVAAGSSDTTGTYDLSTSQRTSAAMSPRFHVGDTHFGSDTHVSKADGEPNDRSAKPVRAKPHRAKRSTSH